MGGYYQDPPKDPEAEAQRIAREKYRTDSGPDVFCTICGAELAPRILRIGDQERRFGHNSCECEGFRVAYQEILVEEKQKAQAYIDDLNRKRIADMIKRSGLGARFSERTFENYIAETGWQKVALSVMQEFVADVIARKDKGRGLILSGSVGTGKTHLAAAAAITLMGAGFETVYGTASAILGEIKKSWKDDTDHDVVGRLCSVPLLVIDDLGKEYSKRVDGWSWAQEQFFQVINARYENYFPVVITTNFNMSQLSDTMGDAIVSRLVECCRGVRCDGEDYRMRRWKN